MTSKIAMSRANTIGFIGLGAMGVHMFANLVRGLSRQGPSKSFVVFDVNPRSVADVLRQHSDLHPSVQIENANSAKEIALKASTIISMVPTAEHVRQVYLGNDGVLSALQLLHRTEVERTLCIDGSTIEQEESRAIAKALRDEGAEMIDAPVSGGVVGAEKATLAIMVGASKEAFERSKPVLEPMGRRVTHCGDNGAGLAAKIANNMLLGISMAGVAEAMLLGKKLGLEPQVLANIINESTGRCWSSVTNNPVPEVTVEGASPPAQRDYQGGFVTKLAHKDLALAVSASGSVGLPLHLGKFVEQLYRPLAQPESEYSNRDFSSIYKAFESES